MALKTNKFEAIHNAETAKILPFSLFGSQVFVVLFFYFFSENVDDRMVIIRREEAPK